MSAAPVNDSQQILHQLSQVSSYDQFKALYLQLDPEFSDSPAFLQGLIAINGFDWLEALLAETFEEQSNGNQRTDNRPSQPSPLPLAA